MNQTPYPYIVRPLLFKAKTMSMAEIVLRFALSAKTAASLTMTFKK